MTVETAMLPVARSAPPTETHFTPQERETAALYHLTAPSLPRWRDYLRQSLLTSAPLWLSDMLSVTLGYSLAAWVVKSTSGLGLAGEGLVTALVTLTVVFTLSGLYPGVGLNAVAEFRLTLRALALCLIVTATPLWGLLGMAPIVKAMVLGWVLSGIVIAYARHLTRRWVSRCDWWCQPALILGSGWEASEVFRTLSRFRTLGWRPIGVVDALHRHWRDDAFADVPYLGPPCELGALATRNRAFWGLVVSSAWPRTELNHVLDRHALGLPHLWLLPESPAPGAFFEGLYAWQGMPGGRLDQPLLLPHSCLVKRLVDLLVAGLASLMLLPLLLTIAAAVRLTSPGPVLYFHERIGRGGRRFRAWKFRTMVRNADRVLSDYLNLHPELREEWLRDQKLRRDPRITPVGRLLRKTSLDELPQLWNVLRGDMSLVGPRPIVEAEVAKYAEEFPTYLSVRPGITGLWQINGRNNTTYEERVQYDVAYVRSWSPWLDIYILACTIDVVVRCKGAY